LGFGQVRVRCHGNLARIEAEPGELHRFVEPGVRQEIVQTFKRAGFYSVCLDLDGYTPTTDV
jgi:uncharacterized protein